MSGGGAVSGVVRECGGGVGGGVARAPGVFLQRRSRGVMSDEAAGGYERGSRFAAARMGADGVGWGWGWDSRRCGAWEGGGTREVRSLLERIFGSSKRASCAAKQLRERVGDGEEGGGDYDYVGGSGFRDRWRAGWRCKMDAAMLAGVRIFKTCFGSCIQLAGGQPT